MSWSWRDYEKQHGKRPDSGPVDLKVNNPNEPADPAPRPVHGRKTLLELKPKDCRWPIGTPGEATFGFCGKPKHTGPYCEEHAGRAYVGTKFPSKGTGFVLPRLAR